MAKGPFYWIRLSVTNPARIVAYLEALTRSPRVLDDGWVDRYGHDKEVRTDIIHIITAFLNDASFLIVIRISRTPDLPY